MYDRPSLVKIAGVTQKIEHSTQLSYSIAQFIFTCDLQACTQTMTVNVSVLGKKINLILVSVWLPWLMPRLRVAWGSSHCQAGIPFCAQVIYVIMKIVTPCSNRPSLLRRSLVGQCTDRCSHISLKFTVSDKNFKGQNMHSV